MEGLPWGPTELTPGSCHVGISFYRPLGETSTLCGPASSRRSTRTARASSLRGHKFHWDEEKEGRSPHLPAEQAQQLVDLVLCRYRRENEDRPPLRVVIHKTSRFEPEERAGFEQALRGVSRYDLVSLSPTSEVTAPAIGPVSAAAGDGLHDRRRVVLLYQRLPALARPVIHMVTCRRRSKSPTT